LAPGAKRVVHLGVWRGMREGAFKRRDKGTILSLKCNFVRGNKEEEYLLREADAHEKGLKGGGVVGERGAYLVLGAERYGPKADGHKRVGEDFNFKVAQAEKGALLNHLLATWYRDGGGKSLKRRKGEKNRLKEIDGEGGASGQPD